MQAVDARFAPVSLDRSYPVILELTADREPLGSFKPLLFTPRLSTAAHAVTGLQVSLITANRPETHRNEP